MSQKNTEERVALIDEKIAKKKQEVQWLKLKRHALLHPTGKKKKGGTKA